MKKLKTLICRVLCKLGFHKIDDSWCQREGCNYHDRESRRIRHPFQAYNCSPAVPALLKARHRPHPSLVQSMVQEWYTEPGKSGKNRKKLEVLRSEPTKEKNPQNLGFMRVCQDFVAGAAVLLGAQEGKRTFFNGKAFKAVWYEFGTHIFKKSFSRRSLQPSG